MRFHKPAPASPPLPLPQLPDFARPHDRSDPGTRHLCILYIASRFRLWHSNIEQALNTHAGIVRCANDVPIMVFLLLALGCAGFGVLAAYITLCDRL